MFAERICGDFIQVLRFSLAFRRGGVRLPERFQTGSNLFCKGCRWDATGPFGSFGVAQDFRLGWFRVYRARAYIWRFQHS